MTGESGGNQTAVLTAIGRIEIEDRAVPSPGEGEVLVAVRAVGVCGSDIHFFEEGRVGESVVLPPHVLGHEASGVVAAVGPGVSDLPVGTRIAIEASLPCGVCRVCRAGRYNLCPRMRYLSAPEAEGAFTRFLVCRREFCFPVDDTVSDEAAALLEPLSIVLAASRLAELRLGDRVLITGAGPIGLLALQLARASGATDVSISDVDDARLAKARELGADQVVDVRRDSVADLTVDADLFMECSGNPAALSDGVRGVRAGGRVAVVGMPPGDVTVPLSLMQANELRMVTTFRLANTYPVAVRLAERRMVDLDGIVSGHYPLAETVQALRAAHDVPGTLKVVVHPQW